MRANFWTNIFEQHLLKTSVHLEPLVDAMKYQFEQKQTPAVDGSKVLPFDTLNAELFYPDRKENKATIDTVKKMAVELANCLLQELLDPTKAMSDYLSCVDGTFSWGKNTDEEHHACMGSMATNDPAKCPCATLTRQLRKVSDDFWESMHLPLVMQNSMEISLVT